MGGDFGAGALSAAYKWLFNQESEKKTYNEKIQELVEAYKQSGLEFSEADARIVLKAALSSDKNALALLKETEVLSEAQMDLALETAVVMSFSGENIELLGESVLAIVKGPQWALKNAIKHDFDMMDIRENLDDGFSSFGFGGASRTTGKIHLSTPTGMGKSNLLFDPNLKDL